MKTKLFSFLVILYCIDSNAQEHAPEDNVLFNAFKQGNVNGGGNCASIALIKAAIGTFGVGNVFTSSKDEENKILLVRLKDDTSYSIPFSEIDLSIKENGFKIKSQLDQALKIKAYADTCFAVMVKVQEKIQKYDSYEKSLSSLLNGYYTPNVYKLLGVEFKEIPKEDLKNNANVIFYNYYHAVYSSFGYYDETKSLLGYSLNTNFKKNRFGPKCSWYLCKPRKAYIIVK